MKITQYNARIQYWYDRSVRVWFCATNDSQGNTTCTARDSLTKKECIDECKDLEEEIQNEDLLPFERGTGGFDDGFGVPCK